MAVERHYYNPTPEQRRALREHALRIRHHLAARRTAARFRKSLSDTIFNLNKYSYAAQVANAAMRSFGCASIEKMVLYIGDEEFVVLTPEYK